MFKIQSRQGIKILVSLCLLLAGFPITASAQDIPEIPDNVIALVANRDDDFDIYLIDPEGNTLSQLTDNNGADINPAWSPDGRQLAFSSDVDGDFDIYVIDLETGNSTRLTDNSWDDISPAWSPDGDQITFTSNRNANWDIYIMNANGRNPERLTTSPVFEGYASWSPDGDRLVYVRDRDANRDIMVIDIDSGEIEALTARPTSADYNPVWSPDGDTIAFVSNRSGHPDIYIVDVDCIGDSDECDSIAVNLTSENSSGGDLPAWSPDSQQIMFIAFGDESTEVFTIDVEDGNIVQITNNSFDERSPTWWFPYDDEE